MFDNFTWRRGSGELDVIDKFADLARKASDEAHAEVMVVLHFPEGYLTWSPPLRRTRRGATDRGRHKRSQRDWSCCANGLDATEKSHQKGRQIRKEIDRLNAIKKNAAKKYDRDNPF